MAMSMPRAASRFVPIAACPVCGCSEEASTFYEHSFDVRIKVNQRDRSKRFETFQAAFIQAATGSADPKFAV